jgi:hypothetical protein
LAQGFALLEEKDPSADTLASRTGSFAEAEKERFKGIL